MVIVMAKLVHLEAVLHLEALGSKILVEPLVRQHLPPAVVCSAILPPAPRHLLEAHRQQVLALDPVALVVTFLVQNPQAAVRSTLNQVPHKPLIFLEPLPSLP